MSPSMGIGTFHKNVNPFQLTFVIVHLQIINSWLAGCLL